MVIFNNQPIPRYLDKFDKWKTIPIYDNQEQLISLRNIHPRIIISPQYFLKGIKGSINDCFVRESIANKLISVANNLQNSYKLIIFDSWRPLQVQKELFGKYKDILQLQFPNFSTDQLTKLTSRFVSVPSSEENFPSPHFTGGAVDLSLADQFNNHLEMGTEFDDFSNLSKTDYFEENSNLIDPLSIAARENRRLLYQCMLTQGFTNYPFEWWHYDFGDQFWALASQKSEAIYGLINT